MARDPDSLHAELEALLSPETRGRLRALGLARSMVWRHGRVPDGGPKFREDLTEDLLDFGYTILALALELRDTNRSRSAESLPTFSTHKVFTLAAECIESAVRRADPADPTRGRHLVVAAAAFHFGGFAARSFSLLSEDVLRANLATCEHALGLLLRRDLRKLRRLVREWLADERYSDERVARRLADENDPFGLDDAGIMALNRAYFRAVGLLDTALVRGSRGIVDKSIAVLDSTVSHAALIGNLTMWWVATLTKHLAEDLWDHSLHVRLPSESAISGLPEAWSEWRRGFIEVLAARTRPQIDLWPSQLEAARRSVDPHDDLIVALPTSSGKTRIAELCILRALAEDKRVMYVTPLRALSAQVEQVLARTFVPLGGTVTSLYGAAGATSLDVKTLATASIVVSTPEKLDFALRQDPDVLNDVGLVVFDEGHMIGVGSREIRYEVLIQRLLRRGDAVSRRIVCLSAMFNPQDAFFHDFGAWLRNDDPGELINVEWRPTRQLLATLEWNANPGIARLQFVDDEKPYVPRFFEVSRPIRGPRRNPFPHEDREFCVAATLAFARDGHDILVYSPQRRQIEPLVETFCTAERQGFLSGMRRPSEDELAIALAIGREWLGERHTAVKALAIGIGTHHGSLPRPFLAAVEDLLHARRLPVVVASPTLAQGIDLACSVLVFRSLTRYDSARREYLPIPPAEFSNVLGRAGRAYVDLDGIAVFPTFKSGRARAKELKVFQNLVEASRGQRLVSGLCILIWNVALEISRRLGVGNADLADLLEFVVNQQDVWSSTALDMRDVVSEEAEPEAELQNFDEMLSDLDLALLSLIEDTSASVDDLATLLDTALTGSLWKRSLTRFEDAEALATLEREVLLSRARWLWKTTTPEQRQACFSAGVGRRAGVFLYDHIEELLPHLADLQKATSECDAGAAQVAALAFARMVFGERFFRPYDFPDDWESVLGSWIEGRAFSEFLTTKAAGFIYDGVVFRLVWAAEAVRVQAHATNHIRATELGDGPALAFTHGLPSVSAALLCQFGYPSRTGALWVLKRLGGDFSSVKELREWISEHESRLTDVNFWESPDHWLLWQHLRIRADESSPKKWERTERSLTPAWSQNLPQKGTELRLVPTSTKSVAVCDEDLTTLGEIEVPSDADDCSFEVEVGRNARLTIRRFGPPP